MRSFRLLHTADWHLGQTLHGIPRDVEHACFLDWLIDRIGEHRVDALVIAGDVFDGQNPPIPALALFYRFVARAKALHPRLDIVVVAGNHDSASRLEAPSPLMTEMGVRVIGTLPSSADGMFDPSPLIVPLRDADGTVAARCVAMPYLRPSDLPVLDETEPSDQAIDPLIEGVRRLYTQAWTGGRERRGQGEALILTGHCYMRGGALSELSERKILGGNLHALPVDIFPEDAAYVALGHLHRAQAVGGREAVRYSGSPIPLALDEEPYPHQVVLAEFAGGRLVGRESLRVPRHVSIHRISEANPEAALERLKRLELDNALPRDAWPFLEVTVTLPEPRPALRDEVEAVLAGRPVRLLKLGVRLTGSGQTLADSAPPVDLASLEPEEVFRRLYRRSHEGDPEADLMAAFHELLTGVQETM